MEPLLPAEKPESGRFGPRCWKPEEDELLRQAVKRYGAGKWALAANLVPGRSNHQCRQRWFFYLDPKINKDPLTDEEYEIILNEQARIGNKWIDIAKLLPGRTYCFISDTWYNSIRRKVVRYLAEKRAIGKLQVSCSEDGRFDFREDELEGALAFVLSKVNRSKSKLQRWSPSEDELLKQAVQEFTTEWVKVASAVPGRSNRQCRLRWANHLDPNVNKEPLTDEEYDILIKAHGSMGNKWADIVSSLPGRTDEFIKYNWCNKIFGKIVKYLMKKRGVDKGQIQCRKGGSFDYQDGELEGAITYVLANVKKSCAVKRPRPLDDETSNSDESELPKPKRIALLKMAESVEVAVSPTAVSEAAVLHDSQEEKSKRKHQSWRTHEDDLLRHFVQKHGDNWSTVASLIPGRSKQQCSYRWTRHLDPNISKEPITSHEYRVFLEAHRKLGNKWVDIAKLLPGRTSSCLCNIWNSSVRRKLVKYLAKSRGITKDEVESEDDGRFKYNANEFEGALFYVTTSVIQGPNASDDKSKACDDDDVALLSDVTSFSEPNEDSLSKWHLKPKVGTAVIQLLRMRQGSPFSWENDHGDSEDS